MSDEPLEMTLLLEDVNPSGLYSVESDRLQLGGGGDVRTFANGMYILISCIRPDLVFTHAYPEELMPGKDPGKEQRVPDRKPTITWKVYRRQPGSLRQKPFAGPNVWKPRWRDRVRDQDDPAVLVNILEMDYDNTIQFDIFAETNKECELLAEWLEDTMIVFAGYFQELGFERVLFQRRFIDQHVEDMGTGLNSRSLHYYVRTKRYYKINVHRLEQIKVKLVEILNN